MENNVTIETFLDRIFKMKNVTLNGVKADISKYVEESDLTASEILTDSNPEYSYDDILRDIELEFEDIDIGELENGEEKEEGLQQVNSSLDDNLTAQELADFLFQSVNG